MSWTFTADDGEQVHYDVPPQVARLEAELEKYSEYTICDCCQSLTLEPVDAGDHMQCVSCTELANAQAELTELRVPIKPRECAKCQGTGQYSYPSSDGYCDCPACNGKGY